MSTGISQATLSFDSNLSRLDMSTIQQMNEAIARAENANEH